MTVEAFLAPSCPFVLARRREWLRHTIRKGTVGKGGVFLVLVRCIWPVDRHRVGLCQVACTRWCCKRLSRRANVLPHSHTKAAKKDKTHHRPGSVRSPRKKGREGRVDSGRGNVRTFLVRV